LFLQFHRHARLGHVHDDLVHVLELLGVCLRRRFADQRIVLLDRTLPSSVSRCRCGSINVKVDQLQIVHSRRCIHYFLDQILHSRMRGERYMSKQHVFSI
jgi:hypothetical protein